MLNLFKKVFGWLVALLLWLWSVLPRALDWVGRSTLPDDWRQLMDEKLPSALQWLFSTPGWVPGILAILLTGWLMWVSWPKPNTRTLTSTTSLDRGSLEAPKTSASGKFLMRRGQEPQEIQNDNVWRWFVFKSVAVNPDAKDKKKTLAVFIFLTFDLPVRSLYRRVSCSTEHVSINVLDVSDRSAVIAAEGDIDDCVVDFYFGPESR